MYGGSYYYPPRYPPEVAVPVPSRPVEQRVFDSRFFKIYGAILALLAATTLSLGIADVVLTKEAYCNPWESASPLWCSSNKEPYIWTWVASGIWCSVPIFLAGLFAMCLSSNPAAWTRMFAFFIFLSAIVFAPGMAILSSIEVWRGAKSEYTFYNLDDGVKAGSIMPPEDNPYVAKFVIPLVIAIVAGIMFFMTGVVTLQLCCCMQSIGIYMPQEIGVIPRPLAAAVPAPLPVYSTEVYYPGRPQINNNYQVDVYRPPVRYNPVGSGVMYGNFPSRAPFGAGFNVGGGFNAGFGSGPVFGSNPYAWR